MFENSRKAVRKWIVFVAAGWLIAAFVLLMVSQLTSILSLTWLTKVYLWASLGTSIAAFLTYGWDKRQAAKEKQRVSEKTLHTLAIAGGWAGAMLGQQYFRHKTQKIAFRLFLPLIAVVHVIVFLFLFF